MFLDWPEGVFTLPAIGWAQARACLPGCIPHWEQEATDPESIGAGPVTHVIIASSVLNASVRSAWRCAMETAGRGPGFNWVQCL